MRSLRTTSTLFGFLSVLVVGCGGADKGANGGEGSVGTDSAAGIAAIGTPSFNNCTASQSFEFHAPQTIDFIAASASKSNNVQMQLFDVDQNGEWTQIQKQTQDLTATLRQIINNSSSNTNSSLQNSNAFANNSFLGGSNTTVAHDATQSATQSGTAKNESNDMNQVTHNANSTASQNADNTNKFDANNTAANNNVAAANNSATAVNNSNANQNATASNTAAQQNNASQTFNAFADNHVDALNSLVNTLMSNSSPGGSSKKSSFGTPNVSFDFSTLPSFLNQNQTNVNQNIQNVNTKVGQNATAINNSGAQNASSATQGASATNNATNTNTSGASNNNTASNSTAANNSNVANNSAAAANMVDDTATRHHDDSSSFSANTTSAVKTVDTTTTTSNFTSRADQGAGASASNMASAVNNSSVDFSQTNGNVVTGFNDLSQMNHNHFVLNVTLTNEQSASQNQTQSQMIDLVQGAGQSVFANSSFSPSFPAGCF